VITAVPPAGALNWRTCAELPAKLL
jgi:hypothetical protein